KLIPRHQFIFTVNQYFQEPVIPEPDPVRNLEEKFPNIPPAAMNFMKAVAVNPDDRYTCERSWKATTQAARESQEEKPKA
ncbi:hypothetical protein GDO86_019776, partial [Hymenochirus boettgeri]